MATVKQEQSGLALEPHEAKGEAELASEPADFELDERLRKLNLHGWFALVEEGTPIWVC